MVSSERFLVSQIGRRRKKPFDVVAPDRRQILAKSLFVHFEQHVTVAFFFLRHLLEQLGGFRIALREVFRETHVNAAVFLFGGDCHRQHFPLCQIGKFLHGVALGISLE